jgi:hypothetical protein
LSRAALRRIASCINCHVSSASIVAHLSDRPAAHPPRDLARSGN